MSDDVPLYLSRYSGFDVLGQADDWDDVTRAFVMKRVREVPDLRFFEPAEARTLEAFADTLVPQDDRPPELRIPLIPRLDERIHENKGDGWRYEGLPPDPELWRTLAAALDDEAARAFGAASFPELGPPAREELARRLHDAAARDAIADEAWGDFGAIPRTREAGGDWEAPEPTAPPLESPLWDRIPPRWSLIFALFEFVGDYYAHPYAWSEIGFGGPKFPHIYPRTVLANPQEAQEVRRGSP